MVYVIQSLGVYIRVDGHGNVMSVDGVTTTIDEKCHPPKNPDPFEPTVSLMTNICSTKLHCPYHEFTTNFSRIFFNWKIFESIKPQK